jgi:hypothetical protein
MDPEFHEMALLKTLPRGKGPIVTIHAIGCLKVAQNKNLGLIEGRRVPYKQVSIIIESRHYSLARVGHVTYLRKSFNVLMAGEGSILRSF